MICVGVVLAYCFVASPSPVDSFCLLYQPVVQAKGDGSIQGTPGAKRRILANELLYRQQCKGVK